jgi:Zinc finger, C3HC4 type (RING finger)
MPVFESRNGSVTLGAFPPTPAPPVVMEDLTPMAKKNISPQVRKVMGKLGMEFGEEARSSRALTPDPCSICFELPTVKNASLAYPCLHTFCDACISEWVKTKSSCPNCQAACTKILYNLRAELVSFFNSKTKNFSEDPSYYEWLQLLKSELK